MATVGGEEEFGDVAEVEVQAGHRDTQVGGGGREELELAMVGANEDVGEGVGLGAGVEVGNF